MAEKIKLGSNGNFGVKEGGTLAYNDENGVFKAIELASSRASGATYVAESGLIADAKVGVPRIDWTNGVGELLLEPQSTNEITYSEDFDNVAWSKTGGGVGLAPVVTANQGLSPDGSVNADRVQFDLSGGVSSSDFSLLLETISVTSGATTTKSVYLKSNDGSTYDLIIYDGQAAGAFTQISVTNDWQRFDITDSVPSTSSQFFIGLRNVGSVLTSDTADILVWGAQLEELSYPTSYIRTSGSAVTRIKDAVSGNSSLGQVINSSEGVLYFEGSGFQDIPSGNLYFSICDGTNSNSIFFRLSTTGALIAYNSGLVSPTNIIAELSAGSIDLDSNFKLSIRWGSTSDDFQLFVNGSKVTQKVGFVFSPLSGLNKLIFSLFDGSGEFHGRIRELKVYDTALTDAELTTLTTI